MGYPLAVLSATMASLSALSASLTA